MCLHQAPHRKRAKAEFLAQPLRYHPVDLSWWNKEAVVLARLSGALTVLGIQDLSNLLGHSPEFLEGVPRISHCLKKGFFGLECETSIKGRRPSSFDDSAGEDPDVELEESDGEEEEPPPGTEPIGVMQVWNFFFEKKPKNLFVSDFHPGEGRNC